MFQNKTKATRGETNSVKIANEEIKLKIHLKCEIMERYKVVDSMVGGSHEFVKLSKAFWNFGQPTQARKWFYP